MQRFFFAWQYFYPVSTVEGWQYQVIYRHIEKPSALIIDEDNNLLVAHELNRQRGSITRISPGGNTETVFSQLDKPDGILPLEEGYIFSQESGKHPLIRVHNQQTDELFTGVNLQGLTRQGDTLYAVEDRKGDGRLFQYNIHTRELNILRNSLYESEILAVCPDGSKFYNEKTRGRIRQFTEDGADPVYLSGLNQPSFLRCDEDGLWISEDATHRARLLLYTPRKELKTIAAFLKAPQHLYKVDEQTYYLAEQGRNRILKLTRDCSRRSAQCKQGSPQNETKHTRSAPEI